MEFTIHESNHESIRVTLTPGLGATTRDLVRAYNTSTQHSSYPAVSNSDAWIVGGTQLMPDTSLETHLASAAGGVVNTNDVTLERNTSIDLYRYTCSDCGATVMLHNDSIIQCRACESHIVYKPRLARRVAYQAR